MVSGYCFSVYRQSFISEKFRRARQEKTIALLEGISPKSILDVGCGYGHFLAMLKEKYPGVKLYGCDLEKEDLSYAKADLPSAEFFQGDFLDLELKPVNLVTMLDVVEHAPNPKLMIRKAASLIGREGRLLVSIPRPELLHWRAIWAVWSRSAGRKWERPHTDLTQAQLYGIVKECGLELEKNTTFFFGCISINLFKPMDKV